MVNTGNHSGCVDSAHDECAYTEGNGNQCLCTDQNPGLDLCEDRSDDSHAEESCHENGYQRSDKEIKHLRYLLVQRLLDGRHQPYGEDHRDDVSLIAYVLDVPGAEPGPEGGCLCTAGHGPGIHKIRVNHHHTDDGTQILVSAEDLRCRNGDQDRQEGQCRIGEHIQQLIQV